MSAALAPGEVGRTVVRGAARQCLLELRSQFRTLYGLSWFLMPAIGLGAMFFLRGTQIDMAQVSVAQFGVPGLLTMYLVMGGMLGVAAQMTTDGEDGSLLRAKATPHGMSAHLLSLVFTFTAISVIPAYLLLVCAAVIIPGTVQLDAGGLLTLAWVTVFGLSATLPIGALLGSVFRGPMALGWSSMAIYGSLAIAGVFYPITALPGWLQVVGQVLPTYWVGLGLRSAMLPDAAAAAEIGQSWRPLLTFVVLLAWTVVGGALVPAALRRVSRRQSASVVSAARQRVMSRGY